MKAREQFQLDPIHREIPIWDLPLSMEIWRSKYQSGDEVSPALSAERVVNGVYNYTANSVEQLGRASIATTTGLWLPAGRIWSGSGTSKVVTLMNCYVMPYMPDSMEGISENLKASMLTMQQGGGIGVDFSTLRPKKAYLKRTQSEASGPIKFMETWDAMCRTIKSAGSRRGAMMATMLDTHPDLPEFIQAKSKEGILRNFNVSILVTDAFIAAVEEDADWPLYFKEPTYDKKDMYGEFEDDSGIIQYIYSIWKARELWDIITRNTYEYSEPGVIFIDRINELNNLSYTEDIHCTNPCGEQPLPPNGCCNLGAVNLALCVCHPFTKGAHLNLGLIKETTKVGVRFLDNVIDVTQYPLNDQKKEEFAKRRIGLGITGLADMLAQLGVRYGSDKSVETVNHVMKAIANTAYGESAKLALERGTFPEFKLDKFMSAPFINELELETRDLIKDVGLRNGVLLTVAPTGTTSVFAGNISSGIEPIFAHFQDRKVLQPNDTWKEHENVPGFTARLYAHYRGIRPSELLTPESAYYQDLLRIAPESSVLTIDGHLNIHSAVQKWVDASVSKTINIPHDYPYDDFKDVYKRAYAMGCKGCTTYRPSTVRGAIIKSSKPKVQPVLSVPESAAVLRETAGVEEIREGRNLWERPDVLEGCTYRIRWPNNHNSLYLTINNDKNGIPRECFIQSRNAKHQEWTTALTLMISATLRRGGDITFIPRVLRGVQSMSDTAWIKGKFYGSLVAYIGFILESHFEGLDLNTDDASDVLAAEISKLVTDVVGETCLKCGSPAMVSREGCKECQVCGHSTCD